MKVIICILCLLFGGSLFAQRDSISLKEITTDSAADVMPEYPGGTLAMSQYFMKCLEFDIADSICSEGLGCVRIYFELTIGKDGTVTHATATTALRGECSLALDKSLRRVEKKMLEMPKWKNGIRNGQPIEVTCRIPMYVRLL